MKQLRAIVFLLFFIKACDVQFAEKCGHPLGMFSGKIVGGFEIGYFKYPWFTVFMKGDEQHCGGTLISIRHVVTAAHCYKAFIPDANAGKLKLENIFTLTLGVYNNCATENTQKVFKVAKVYIHELYKKYDPYYDIALVKATKDVNGFEPCCLPPKPLYSSTRPKDAYIQGVGDLVFDAKESTCTVHEARVMIHSDDTCRKMLDNAGDSGKDLKHSFCAGYIEGGIDTCQGDSGGPLIILGPESKFMLLGITSFGYECAKKGALGVYVDASHFLDWLKNKIKIQVNATQGPPVGGGDNEIIPDSDPNRPSSNGQRPIIIIINARNKTRNDTLKQLRNKNLKKQVLKIKEEEEENEN